jgi:hypothetical protein
MAAQLVVCIISNAEVSLTECGQLMAASVPDLASPTLQPVAAGGWATWDDVERPPDAWVCPACYRVYMS